jgi:hypothetical protein
MVFFLLFHIDVFASVGWFFNINVFNPSVGPCLPKESVVMLNLEP